MWFAAAFIINYFYFINTTVLLPCCSWPKYNDTYCLTWKYLQASIYLGNITHPFKACLYTEFHWNAFDQNKLTDDKSKLLLKCAHSVHILFIYVYNFWFLLFHKSSSCWLASITISFLLHEGYKLRPRLQFQIQKHLRCKSDAWNSISSFHSTQYCLFTRAVEATCLQEFCIIWSYL